MPKRMIALALAGSLCACANHAERPEPSPEGLWPAAATALASISANDLMRHTRVLSSDEFEGRAPGSRGEDLTVAYVTEEFKKLGLRAGNPNGTYTQDVPLIGFAAHPSASLNAGGRTVALQFPDDYVALSRHFQPQIDVENSDIVFVGYGVVAPEYGWDDYKDVDVRGKTILMLINDPAVPDPADPSRLDPKLFKGNAMTYYGRWTYKYEIASRKGAAAAIIIHETGPAGYPYEVVSASWGRENFDIRSTGEVTGRTKVETWIRLDKAKELLQSSGQDFDALKRAAVRKDFRPVKLNAQATFHLPTHCVRFSRAMWSRSSKARNPMSSLFTRRTGITWAATPT